MIKVGELKSKNILNYAKSAPGEILPNWMDGKEIHLMEKYTKVIILKKKSKKS